MLPLVPWLNMFSVQVVELLSSNILEGYDKRIDNMQALFRPIEKIHEWVHIFCRKIKNKTTSFVYRDFWTSVPDVLSPHGASLNLAIAPEALLKVLNKLQFIINITDAGLNCHLASTIQINPPGLQNIVIISNYCFPYNFVIFSILSFACCFLAVPWQLYRFPCHWVSNWLTESHCWKTLP